MIFENVKTAPCFKLGGHKEQVKKNTSVDASMRMMLPRLPRGIKVTGDDRLSEPITLMPSHLMHLAAPDEALGGCDGGGGRRLALQL